MVAALTAFVARRRTPGRRGCIFPHMPVPRLYEAEIDRVARVMAAGAGIVWDRLDHYPGYMRGFWRNEARELLGRLADGDLSRAA